MKLYIVLLVVLGYNGIVSADRVAPEKAAILTVLPHSNFNSGTITGDRTMKTIPLTRGKYAIVDDEDYERISKHKWYALKGKHTYYAVREISLGGGTRKNRQRTFVLMHREILNVPQGMDTDHENHNGLDNCRSNIRICSSMQNSQNARKRKGCSSRYKGVHRAEQIKRWRAVIYNNKQKISLGCYGTEEEAALAYDKKARQFFGEFANTNYKTLAKRSN